MHRNCTDFQQFAEIGPVIQSQLVPKESWALLAIEKELAAHIQKHLPLRIDDDAY